MSFSLFLLTLNNPKLLNDQAVLFDFVLDNYFWFVLITTNCFQLFSVILIYYILVHTGYRLIVGSRITKTHDFGFVSLDMSHVRDEDEGVYMCRASNALGEAVTTASMKIKCELSLVA